MQHLLLSIAGACVMVLAASAAFSASEGDAKAGLAYAEHYCSTCHGIAGEASPLAEAPPFHEVAQQKGMTATALQVWLETSHPTMPNIVVPPEDMRNVIAYILSLKGHI